MPLSDDRARWSLMRVGGHIRPLRHRPHDASRVGHERAEGAPGGRRLRVPAEAAA